MKIKVIQGAKKFYNFKIKMENTGFEPVTY